MRLVAAEALDIERDGPAGDRAFVVVDGDGELLETSRTPDLMQVVPRLDPATGALELRFPDGTVAAGVPEPGQPVTVARYDGRPASGRLVDGPFAVPLTRHLGREARLVALDPGQTRADDFPVTLTSAATMAAVAAAVDGPADPRRFRMTVTVDGVEAWSEHGWAGREVAIGDDVVLRVTEPIPRCVVTTRDPDTGRRDAPVLKALARLRGAKDVRLGVWCEVVRPGRVRRGDPVAA
jgi:uncharacterized protein YcbX